MKNIELPVREKATLTVNDAFELWKEIKRWRIINTVDGILANKEFIIISPYEADGKNPALFFTNRVRSEINLRTMDICRSNIFVCMGSGNLWAKYSQAPLMKQDILKCIYGVWHHLINMVKLGKGEIEIISLRIRTKGKYVLMLVEFLHLRDHSLSCTIAFSACCHKQEEIQIRMS